MNSGFMEHMIDLYSARIKVEKPFGMTFVQDDEEITIYLVNTSLVNLFLFLSRISINIYNRIKMLAKIRFKTIAIGCNLQLQSSPLD